MRGLIRTIIIIAVFIAVGIGASIVLTSDLNNRVADARERGLEEGQARGSEEGWQDGSRVGYQEGSKIGYVSGRYGYYSYSSHYGKGFYFAYNPTYNEVQEILAEVEEGSAGKIHDYAETNGIRAAYARCQIARKAAEGMVYVYELVVFETVDKGLIIIDPWLHQEVEVELGQRYSTLNGFPPPAYDDTITKKTIV